MKEKTIFGKQSIRKFRKVQHQYNFSHMVVHILLLKFCEHPEVINFVHCSPVVI